MVYLSPCALSSCLYLPKLTVWLADARSQDQAQRPALWKLLLRLPATLRPEEYYALVQREPSFAYDKIRNDTFRTLATDLAFREKVGEERLVRLLEAFVWRNGQCER